MIVGDVLRRQRRLQVLFVDDQVDVARTLARLLTRTDVAVSFASDGEDALRRMDVSSFDLVVADLHMPPGDWGGLWLLDRIRERGGHTEVLVLSGEAGQRETVQALRSGARDFVIKETAQDELADRVREVATAGDVERIRFGTNLLPCPLALRISDLLRAERAEDVLREALAAVESVMHLVGLLHLATSAPPGLNELAHLARPSMGTWANRCKEAQQNADPRIRRWAEAIAGRDAAEAVQLRNDLAHGAGVTNRIAETRSAAVLDLLDGFLLAARSVAPIELVVPGRLDFDGALFRTEITELQGTPANWARRTVTYPTPATCGRVILTRESSFVPLWPFVLLEDAGQARMLLWDGVRSGRPGEVAAHDPLRYIDVIGRDRLTHRELRVSDLTSSASTEPSRPNRPG